MIEYLIRRKKITLLFFVMIVITGFFSLFSFAREEWPNIPITFAIVTTPLPGASPEKVEQTVTKKLEEKIKEMAGLKSITSSSLPGVSVIMLEAKDGFDLNGVWSELRKKVKDVEKDLPADAKQPIINDTLSKTFLQTFALTANTPEQLYAARDTVKSWKEQLRAVPGVAEVQVVGLPKQEIRIELDTAKLEQYGIPWQLVLAAFKGENEKTPLGTIDDTNRSYLLKLQESYNVKDLEKIIVTRSKEGFPIYLRDVAKVKLTNGKITYYSYLNGKPAITFNLTSENGVDIPSLQQKVDKVLAVITKTIPPGISKEDVYSQSGRVNELFGELTKEIMIAVAAVILVCSLGLNFITASVVALAIPISLSVGLLFAPLFNISLNQISIFSLIIVLGILVDDAVVVNDNIERRLTALGESPFKASVNGSNEVLISILTATLATLASFGPLIFLKGNTGAFIKPVPIIISCTMIASMIMSLTIIPIFREWYEKNKKSKSDYEKPAGLLGKQIVQLTHWYANTLMPVILNKPLRVGTIGVLICAFAYGLIPFTPVQLFPNANRAEMLVDIRLPVGSSIAETNNNVQNVSAWMSSQKGVKMVAAFAGGSAPKMFMGDTAAGEGAEVGQFVVKVDKKVITTADIVRDWPSKFKEKFPGANITPKELLMGPPVGKPVMIKIFGEDIKELRVLSQAVRDKIVDVPGTYNVQDDMGIEQYTMDIVPNKALMDDKMVNSKDLTTTIRLASEGISVGDFDNGKDLIDTKLYVVGENADPKAKLSRLSVLNALGQQVPVSQLTNIKPGFSIGLIPHRELARCVTITSDVRGRTATEVMQQVKPLMSKIKFPESYRWEIAGEVSEQNDVFADMGKLSIIVVFLIVIMIAMQFYSLHLPLLVLSTVYLAIAGSLIGLFVTRTPLGFMTMMGVISLMGIVVRNGIVLIEFIEKARHDGMELKAAVIQAGEARLRPILLTSATAIAGLLPLAISGDVLFRPLAITIIFGLAFSTLLTLILVPSLYTAMALHQEKKEQRRQKREEKTEYF